MVDVPYLDEKIRLSGKSKTLLANKCGLSRTSFYKKISGKVAFTENQATILCDEIGITTLAERRKIFLIN